MSNVLSKTPIDKRQWYELLKQLSSTDLSQAHLVQHYATAESALGINGIIAIGNGAHSVFKPGDTFSYNNGTVSGIKQWVSGIPHCSHAVFYLENGDGIYVPNISGAVIDMIETVGMEDTVTGNLTFDQTPAQLIHNKGHGAGKQVMYQHNYSFITISLGLATGLFNDVKKYIAQNNINCHYDIKKIELNFRVANKLWQDNFAILERNQGCELDLSTMYAFNKELLLSVVHVLTEISGSYIYKTNTAEHQRYKDALIYSSHRLSFYQSLVK